MGFMVVRCSSGIGSHSFSLIFPTSGLKQTGPDEGQVYILGHSGANQGWLTLYDPTARLAALAWRH